jgi:hypothetical protein
VFFVECSCQPYEEFPRSRYKIKMTTTKLSCTLTLAVALFDAVNALSAGKFYSAHLWFACLNHCCEGERIYALEPRARRCRSGHCQKRTIGFAVAFSIFAAVILTAIVWWCLRQRKKPDATWWPARFRSQPQGSVVAKRHRDNVWFGGTGMRGGGVT